LYLLKERDQIIKVFEEKGFHKKTKEQIYKEQRLRRAEKDIERLEESPFAGMMITYVSIGSVAVLALVCIRRSRTRRSRVLTASASQNLSV
jgi:nucleoside diphosphate kinase